MTEALPLLLGLSDLLLALLVFVLLARPELLLGLTARLSGLGERWELGALSEAEELRLRAGLEGLALPALLGLFAWSLLTGGLVALSRL